MGRSLEPEVGRLETAFPGARGDDSVLCHFGPLSCGTQSGKVHAMSLRFLTYVFAALAGALLLQPGAASAAKNSLTVGMVVEPEGLDPTIAAPTTIREV